MGTFGRKSIVGVEFFFLFAAFFFLPVASVSAALEADEVLVIANRWASHSVSLATYYMKKRGVPKENLLKVKISEKEVCSRADYNKKIALLN